MSDNSSEEEITKPEPPLKDFDFAGTVSYDDKTKKRLSPGKNTIIIGSIACFGLITYFLTIIIANYYINRFTNFTFSPDSLISQRQVNQYYEARGTILGKYLQQKFPAQKVLFLYTDYELENISSVKMMEALEKLFGRSNFSKYKLKTEQLGLSEIWLTTELDKAMAAHPDCSIIISTMGTPFNYKDMKILNRPKIKLALLSGVRALDLELLESGVVAAAVARRPNGGFKEYEWPKTNQAIFNCINILVTPENVEHVKKKYPQIFEIKGHYEKIKKNYPAKSTGGDAASSGKLNHKKICDT